MIDVCLLGTGGMMPLPGRFLTSLYVRYNGRCVLIDCGEGTQITMKKRGISAKPIDVICFTHYHADHISGLPGLLLTMGNAERTEPLLMVGPKGLERVVGCLRVIAPELPFEIRYLELDGEESSFSMEGCPEFEIKAFRVNHNITCYGYTMSLRRQGKFDVERANAAGIDRMYWSRLQKGETVTLDDGTVYTPDMVLGSERKGIKLTYCTDSRPTDSIVRNAAGSDLFICEGMYGEADKLQKARENKHMTFYEAARMADKAGVSEMWLTHYSPSLVNPMEFIEDTRKIFANTVAARDGRSVELKYLEE